MRQRSVVLLTILVGIVCFWSGCTREDVVDPAREVGVDEILQELSNANTQAEVEAATNHLLDKAAVGAPERGETGASSQCIQCLKNAVDEYMEAKEALTEQFKEGLISKEQYAQQLVDLNAAAKKRVDNCLIEDDFRKRYKDIVFPEIQLAELIPGRVIFGEFDNSGHRHFVDLLNQAAEEGQIPDELEAVSRAIESKLTQAQIDALLHLDLDELQQFIRETGKVPAWLDEIFEAFEEDPTLSFLMPKVSPPKIVPPEVILPKVIWPGVSPKAAPSSVLQFEPAAAPSSEYDDCIQAAESAYDLAVIAIETAYDNKVTQINQQYDNLISLINNAHATCVEAAEQNHNVRLAEIGVALAACEALAAVIGVFCPPCGVVSALGCVAAAAVDTANSAILLSQDRLACNDTKTQNEQAANNIKAQNTQAANNAKAEALQGAQAQLADDRAACHDQGGG